MKAQNAYEVLMVNHAGYITEGSRSNFFLIRENTLYSAPADWILPGVTRKQVLKLASEASIQLVEAPILFSDLAHFEAAFMCGTSPKVMPVKSIDQNTYSVTDPLLTKLMHLFNAHCYNYIHSRIK
jgi:branched-chain amino acid aminotransferase